MPGLVFELQPPVLTSAPNRADVACFVGWVGRRPTPLPVELRRWLHDRGWADPPYGRQGAWLLSQADLRDPVGLAIALNAVDARPAVRQVRQSLERQAPGLLSEADPELWASSRWQQALRVGLNNLLQGESLYHAAAFAGEPLDADTQHLLTQPRRGNTLVQLNRRLLQQVFPEAIAHSQLLALDDLLNVPVPIDRWDLFDTLFAWDERVITSQIRGTSYLGAAVRSFFAQGGTLCYIVRLGDPGFLLTPQAERQFRLRTLLPGYPHGLAATPSDRPTWSGLGHVLGLPEVSFVALPDLPELLSGDRPPVEPASAAPLSPESFVECSDAVALPADRLPRFLTAPRCRPPDYQRWAGVLHRVGNWLARYRREVQLVAALPLPEAGTPMARDPLSALVDQGTGPLAHPLETPPQGIASAFVQLAYPWVRTRGSDRLPDALEPPDGIVLGVLARNALTQGTFHSAAGLGLIDVHGVEPLLSRDQAEALVATDPRDTGRRYRLLDRVSLLGLTPGGWRLRSDVTTSLSESYRVACVNRLIASLVRAARRLGEEYTFDNSGEALWGQLRESFTTLLLGLLQAGALRGNTVDEAFQVRCDRSTMTQADLDNGRVIVEVQITAALPIEQITVVLALNENGQVTVLSTLPRSQVAA